MPNSNTPPPHYISDNEEDDDIDSEYSTILPIPPDVPDPIIIPRYNLRSRYSVACTVLNESTGKLEEYPALIKGKDKEVWYHAYGNDLCLLAQGMPGLPEGTDTIKFIHRSHH